MEAPGQGHLLDGRYRLSAVIGRGGMGVVWRARDELLSRDVAVKQLVWPAYFSEAEQQAVCRRASREARMAARLSHRNVIRVFDFIEEDGRPWLVMELLPYGSLSDLIKEKGPLTSVQAAKIGLELLAALRAAHASGVVHRDVKPANILVAPDRVVLTDFGIARPAGRSVTTVGILVGSPSYIAPERAMTGQSGPAGDLWGLGASLYAAVEGHGPFDRDAGALASLTAVVTDEPAPAAHAGPLLWPVISGLLRKDPDKRMDAAEAQRLLRRAAGAPVAPLSAPVGPVSQTIPRPGRTRVQAVAAGSAALAALAVSGTLVGLSRTSSPQSGTAPAAVAPPAAGSTRTPAPRTSTGTHPTPRTSQPQAPHAPISRHTTTTTSSTTGPGTVRHGRFAGQAGRLAVSVPHQGRNAERWHPAPRPGRQEKP